MHATLTQDQTSRIVDRPHLPRTDNRRDPFYGNVRSAAFHDQDLTVLTREELRKRGETLAWYHDQDRHACIDIGVCGSAIDGSTCRFALYLLVDARAEWKRRAAKVASGR
jgi:hypothetical protein